MCQVHTLAIFRGEVSRALVKAIAHNRYGGDAQGAPLGTAYHPIHAALTKAALVQCALIGNGEIDTGVAAPVSAAFIARPSPLGLTGARENAEA
jgi:hypothetical protein